MRSDIKISIIINSCFVNLLSFYNLLGKRTTYKVNKKSDAQTVITTYKVNKLK